MRRVVLLLPLLLGGCSCQPESARSPEAQQAPQAASAVDTEPASADETASAVVQPTAPVLSAVVEGATDEITTVHQYVMALLRPDRAASDAYWTGGSAGSRPDDQVLRAIPDLRSLRVKTSSPIARDSAQPSRLREVPVKVRAMTSDGILNYEGWYRLQPRADESGWEIVGASVQPVLR